MTPAGRQRLCELADRHVPHLDVIADDLDDAEQAWAFEAIGSAARRVLGDILQKRVDQAGG